MGTVANLRDSYHIEKDVFIREITFASEQTVAIENPFAGYDTNKIDVQITQKGSSALSENFSFDFDTANGEIDFHSTSATSTAVIRVRIGCSY